MKTERNGLIPGLAVRMRRFTLIELLVVIAIIAILASILLPTLRQAKQKAHCAICISNMRNLSVCLISYVDDFNGYYAPARAEFGSWNSVLTWDDFTSLYDGRNGAGLDNYTCFGKESTGVVPGATEAEPYRCPGEEERGWNDCFRRSYAMAGGYDNRAGIGRVVYDDGTYGFTWSKMTKCAEVISAGETFLLAEVQTTDDQNIMSGGQSGRHAKVDNPSDQQHDNLGVAPRHGNGHSWNYLFADGHTETLRPESTMGTDTDIFADRSHGAGYWTITLSDN